MKLKKLKISNFRGYKHETVISFDSLTTFVGQNDIGKSTILEALDIFFYDGKGLIKIDKKDINAENQKQEIMDIIISAEFSDLPDKVVIDATNETTLQKEYLLNSDGNLEIIKTFKNGGNTATSLKVNIKANHPSNSECNELLLKKNTDLKKIADNLKLSCDKTKNAEMRAAIWTHYIDNLQLSDINIDVSSKDGDIKSVWAKLQTYLPFYSLFRSDRKNSDNDDEVQDPLKEAVKQILKEEELQNQFMEIAEKVKNKLQEVSDLTLAKLKEMNPEIASSLHPNIPSSETLKWPDVFKNLSISGDEDIPINKRGSGVRRLILLNFFRAEAERRKNEGANPSIIYAIEEPETSQHIDHQIKLIKALKDLSNENNTQIIFTTHSSEIVKNLDFSNLRLLSKKDNSVNINNIEKYCLPYPSLNEVNYVAFMDASVELHNELFGFLQAKAGDEDLNNWYEKNFDSWLKDKGCKQSKKWIKIIKGIEQPSCDCTLQMFIRNSIHHPENISNDSYSNDELKESIKEMVTIVKNLTNTSDE